MALHISYESVGFPARGPVTNGSARLPVSWDKLLWAALTVGRPNRQYVFAHAMSSAYEALFRLSLVRMALEQAGPGGRVLRRTAAARSLDPTEKGAVNYFLGMAVAKVFADELLNVPWMLHLDVFRAQINAVLNGRSRPDLIGQSISGQWVALECKGRVSAPNRDAKTKAKQQAQRVLSIGTSAPAYAIGAITYFRNESLRFFWEDPEIDPKVKRPFDVGLDEKVWDEYYAPVLALIRRAPTQIAANDAIVWVRVEEADADVGVHAGVLEALEQTGGAGAKRVAEALHVQQEFLECNADGIVVRSGKSWERPFTELWYGGAI